MESSLYVYTSRNDISINFNKSNPLKVLILGKGKSSNAVIEYFNNKNATIEILEPKNKKEYYDFIKRLPLFDICFRSPGIPRNKRILIKDLTRYPGITTASIKPMTRQPTVTPIITYSLFNAELIADPPVKCKHYSIFCS